MKNLKTTIDGTGTMSVTGRIYYLRTMLRGEDLREFYKLASQNSGPERAHFEFILKDLLEHHPLINNPPKQKREMDRAMRKL